MTNSILQFDSELLDHNTNTHSYHHSVTPSIVILSHPHNYFILHFCNQHLGPDESHIIHKIRATTVIFEEDSPFDEPVIANIVLPNRPHATSLQVEEVGSFKFETNEQSVAYQVVDGSGHGRQMQGIIDEMDSDNEHGYAQKRGASRNISIASASDDDVSIGYAKEVSVDEFHKDYQFDDGYANVSIRRTVVEEEEMYVGDADDNDSKQTGKLYEVKETFDDEIDDPLPTKVKVSDVSNGNAKMGGKALLCDVEEKEEHSSLSAEEAKQLRIKEIRAKARKASIVNKEDMTTDTVEDNRKTAEIIDQPKLEAKNANLLNRENVDELDSIDSGALPKQAKVENLGENEQPQKGKQRQINEIELDDDFENLMKRAQRQRNILNDILDKEHGIASEEEILHRSSVIDNDDDSGSHPGIYNIKKNSTST